MSDVLDRIREEMSARLAELRPLAEEHARLTAALRHWAMSAATRLLRRHRRAQHNQRLARRSRRLPQLPSVRLAEPTAWPSSNAISLQSFNFRDRFLRHRDFHLFLEPADSDLARRDATFVKQPAPVLIDEGPVLVPADD